jgi:acyl carrier protein phosphodiesterase
MISDYVKGKKKFDYSPGIQQGMNLHRAIDTFTDDHAVTKEAKQIFRPHYRLYAGAFIDVVYDHYWQQILSFSAMIRWKSLLPAPTQCWNLIPPFSRTFCPHVSYMKTQNWLYNYSNKWELKTVCMA